METVTRAVIAKHTGLTFQFCRGNGAVHISIKFDVVLSIEPSRQAHYLSTLNVCFIPQSTTSRYGNRT
jgi:hypothetical protein